MFQVVEADRRFQLRMSATLNAIEEADDRMTSWLAKSEWTINLFAMRVMIHEALLNAVTHGSRCNPECIVTATIEMADDQVILTVEDDGPGFNWSKQRSMDTLAHSGRGLALLAIYADCMQFNERGNRLTISRRREVQEEQAWQPLQARSN